MTLYPQTMPTTYTIPPTVQLGAVLREFVDEVPSETLSSSAELSQRVMPWSPSGPVAEDATAVDVAMLGNIENLVIEVDAALQDDGPEDPSLAKVGKVNSFRSTRPGYQASMARAAAAGLSNTALNVIYDEALEEDPLQQRPPSRFGLRRLLKKPVNLEAETVAAKERSTIAFEQRLKRIEKGKQWQPEGVLNAVGRHGQASTIPMGQRPRVRFAIFVAFVSGLTVAGIGPDNVKAFGQSMAERVDLAAVGPLAEDLNLGGIVPGL